MQKLWVIRPHLWPQIEILSSEATHSRSVYSFQKLNAKHQDKGNWWHSPSWNAFSLLFLRIRQDSRLIDIDGDKEIGFNPYGNYDDC